MTGEQRAAIREAIDLRIREVVTADDSRRMVRWFTCPTHHLKVGVGKHDNLLGRCAGCAEEAATALFRWKEGYE